MRTLVFEPGYSPYEAFFKNSEEAIQRVIDAESTVQLPFENNVIALVCAKEQNMDSPNRAINTKTVIHGRFFICGWDGTHLRELTRKQADRYYRRYLYPEKFENNDNGLQVVPLPPKVKPTDERMGRKGWLLER